MAEEGTFCVNADVVKKAGANVNAAATAEAFTNAFILQAEARIISLTREDLRTNYSSLNSAAKGLLREACSNLAAVYAIQYDMSGFTSRVEAEDMVNILTYNFKECMKIIADQKFVGFSDSATTRSAIVDSVMELSMVAGESLVNGDLCYLKSDGKAWKTDADAESTAKGMIVMCTETLAADATGTFLVRGSNTIAGHGFTTGAELYLSTTAGAMTATPPSGTGDIVRVIGYALNSTTILFDPDRTYLEM